MDTASLDRDIETLQANKDAWAQLPIGRRIEYLRGLLKGTEAVAHRQVQAAIAAKGIDPGSALVGEEYFGGPVIIIRTLRLLIRTLEDIERHGSPQLPKDGLRTRNGQTAVQVFPLSTLDKLTFSGFSAEVWMEPGVTPETLPEEMAGFYRGNGGEGRVALVLGAGNVASIGPLDMVHKLFAEGQVCLLKFNPVNDYLGPFVEESFAELIRDGFVRTAYGGADVGAYLCQHPRIDEVHITGSDKTHDAIVFGGGAEGRERKAKNRPLNHKRITSELGNVSPVIIVPGPWTESDLRFHAENVATQMANNGGFNCNAAKVIVLHEAWPQKRAFMDMLRAVLAAIPQRRAYYPGAADRYEKFVGAHPQAQPIGPRSEGVLPWTLIPDVPAAKADDMAFTDESFCGITAQTALPGADAREFLANAVRFCNETLWGTLNACVIVHPRTAEALGDALDEAIGDLEYGSVGVNHWPALSYALGSTTWGAWPGHTLDDIQSGIGVVHNTFLFDRPQKSVIRGPFRVTPKPPWFVTHKRTDKVARAMLALESAPGFAKVPAIAFHALLG
ncbi:MAG: aldehyde dehydrogenase family protein [Myxococcales bacterium]|nr:aldehyde dehydrogenase family protein [Myxococcales bacterium]